MHSPCAAGGDPISICALRCGCLGRSLRSAFSHVSCGPSRGLPPRAAAPGGASDDAGAPKSRTQCRLRKADSDAPQPIVALRVVPKKAVVVDQAPRGCRGRVPVECGGLADVLETKLYYAPGVPGGGACLPQGLRPPARPVTRPPPPSALPRPPCETLRQGWPAAKPAAGRAASGPVPGAPAEHVRLFKGQVYLQGDVVHGASHTRTHSAGGGGGQRKVTQRTEAGAKGSCWLNPIQAKSSNERCQRTR